MKPVLIFENASDSLKPIVENNQTNKDSYTMGGIFTELGVKNRNDRVYTEQGFLPALGELNERMSTLGVVYGEFDHPENFDTSLAKASHFIKTIGYEKESKQVKGSIRLLSTTLGREAKAIINDGLPLFVSSRAAGVTESDGTVSLKKLFTYDLVADPGFASARLNMINESCGYNKKSNVRIYDITDTSKINELFNMNNNDFVTRTQLADYSTHIVNEIASVKKNLSSAIKEGKKEPKEITKMMEYYESLHATHNDVIKYLDYLAETMQTLVSENKMLKENQDKIISHNDYICEELEKTVEYSEYLAEQLDKTIDYSEYLAESLDKNIDYSEYLAENLDKNIDYSEYLAENLDKNIEYSEYLAENLDKNIDYSEYLAEHVENNIAYGEYIAENLDDNIAYADYIAEGLDKSIKYSKRIVEKLNGNKIYESLEDTERFPLPEDAGLPNIDEEEEEPNEFPEEEEEGGDEFNTELDETPEMDEIVNDEECIEGDPNCDPNAELDEESEEEENHDEHSTEININIDQDGTEVEQNESLTSQIEKLIQEAKKRKASETNEHHFLSFLNKSQIDSFYGLGKDEQEQVVSYINEKGNYFTAKEVLTSIREALSTKTETTEDKIVRLMPEQIKPIWANLSESTKVSILSQARLHPDLNSDEMIEHFWLTRNIKKNESVNKQLLSTEQLINEDKLSDDKLQSIMEKFRKL